MNRDPIFIRVDATPQVGYERLARCLTLAAAVQRRRRPVYFLSRLEPNGLALGIKRAGHDWIDVGAAVGTEDDAVELLQEVRRLRPAALVVDDAEANQAYLSELSRCGPMLVSIDHLAMVPFPSKLVINPLLGPGRESYEFAR